MATFNRVFLADGRIYLNVTVEGPDGVRDEGRRGRAPPSRRSMPRKGVPSNIAPSLAGIASRRAIPRSAKSVQAVALESLTTPAFSDRD